MVIFKVYDSRHSLSGRAWSETALILLRAFDLWYDLASKTRKSHVPSDSMR